MNRNVAIAFRQFAIIPVEAPISAR
jgi:hypothetical protein